MTINVDTGKIDKECELNRSYACCGCEHYYDKNDTVCKRGCINYVKNNYDTRKRLIVERSLCEVTVRSKNTI